MKPVTSQPLDVFLFLTRKIERSHRVHDQEVYQLLDKNGIRPERESAHARD